MRLYKIIFLVIGLISYEWSIAQPDLLDKSIVLDTNSTTYRVMKKDFIMKYEIYKKKHKEKLKSSFQDKTGKEVFKDYEEASKVLTNQIWDNQYIFDEKINSLVKSVLSNFKHDDLKKPDDTPFLISKDLSLNAFCFSDGTLIINAGVFLWLQNEDQLASVLAHELAHHSLNHYNKFQYEHFKTQNSDKEKATVKSIQNASENNSKLALNLLRNQLYSKAKIQRKNEFEADSLGLIYYSNTGYKQNEFLKGMELMMKYDTLPFIDMDSSVYYDLYDLPQQKFKRSWLEGEDFSKYQYAEDVSDFNEDSLSSHPPLHFRINKLKNYKLDTYNSVSEITPNQNFENISTLISAEFYPILYYNEAYDDALYGIMLSLKRNPESTFHKQWLGFLFQKIYDARKAYTLNRYVESVDMRDKNLSYQRFLSFIWQLSLKEIKTIADHYSRT